MHTIIPPLLLTLLGALVCAYVAHLLSKGGKRRRRTSSRKRTDAILRRLAFLVPRRNREAITGDIYEDVEDLRAAGESERVIRFVVLWQFAWAVAGGIIGAMAGGLRRLRSG